jgi:hypothetical protein
MHLRAYSERFLSDFSGSWNFENFAFFFEILRNLKRNYQKNHDVKKSINSQLNHLSIIFKKAPRGKILPLHNSLIDLSQLFAIFHHKIFTMTIKIFNYAFSDCEFIFFLNMKVKVMPKRTIATLTISLYMHVTIKWHARSIGYALWQHFIILHRVDHICFFFGIFYFITSNLFNMWFSKRHRCSHSDVCSFIIICSMKIFKLCKYHTKIL